MTRSRGTAAAVGVALLAGAFHLATLREGHAWGDDFSQYVAQARNLVTGRDYRDTGYVYNPHRAILGPRATQPLFPLLLAPVYALAGLDLQAMKAAGVLWFVLFVLLVHRLLRDRLTEEGRLGVTIVVAASPFLWDFKDWVMADLPFADAMFLGLLAIDAHVDAPAVRRNALLRGAALGLLLFCSYAIRAPGLLLPVVLVGLELFRHRRPSRGTVVACLVFGLGTLLQSRLLGTEQSYAEQARTSAGTILANVVWYLESLSQYVDAGLGPAVRTSLLAVVSGLSAVGLAWQLRTPRALELFALLYVALILVWPGNEGMRYLIPLFPAWLAWAVTALEKAPSPLGGRPARAIAAGLLVLLLAAYAGRYHGHDFGPLCEGIGVPASQELFAWVRASTPPDAVLVFRKPRALALLTDRRVASYHDAPDEALLAFFREIHATHVVRAFALDPPEWDDFLFRSSRRLVLSFENDGFEVYAIDLR